MPLAKTHTESFPINFSDPSGLTPCKGINVKFNQADLDRLNDELKLSGSDRLTVADVQNRLYSSLPSPSIQLNAKSGNNFNVNLRVQSGSFNSASLNGDVYISPATVMSVTNVTRTRAQINTPFGTIPAKTSTASGSSASRRDEALNAIATGVALSVGGKRQTTQFGAGSVPIPGPLQQAVDQRLNSP